MPATRCRTVEGTCRPCKKRRIKCDMNKPSCRKCILSGSDCSYDAVHLKWMSSTPRGARSSRSDASRIGRNIPADSGNLSTYEKRSIDYFKGRLWGLLTTSAHVCPAPISMVLQSRPVLLAACTLADAHRTVFDERIDKSNWQVKRLSCLASLRQQIELDPSGTTASPSILVAILLLYFLDGLIDCTKPSVSTITVHQAGAKAMIDHLGGYTSILQQGNTEVNFLLCQFAAADLTSALLHGHRPCFTSKIWSRMEESAVWWEKPRYGARSIAFVLSVMADMAFYRHSIEEKEDELSFDKVSQFELILSTPHGRLTASDLLDPIGATISHDDIQREMQAQALYRAFVHSALIYLLRALCRLPVKHHLVQQHTNECLECINWIDPNSKVQNCLLYPLYVAGAHMIDPEKERLILTKFDEIYRDLRFECVVSIRTALEDLWKTPRRHGTWEDMFQNVTHEVHVF